MNIRMICLSPLLCKLRSTTEELTYFYDPPEIWEAEGSLINNKTFEWQYSQVFYFHAKINAILGCTPNDWTRSKPWRKIR